jgi:hypothetical protein
MARLAAQGRGPRIEPLWGPSGAWKNARVSHLLAI